MTEFYSVLILKVKPFSCEDKGKGNLFSSHMTHVQLPADPLAEKITLSPAPDSPVLVLAQIWRYQDLGANWGAQ